MEINVKIRDVSGDVVIPSRFKLYLLNSCLKLSSFLCRSLAAVAGWIKTVLATEQKKTDYNPLVNIFIQVFWLIMATG